MDDTATHSEPVHSCHPPGQSVESGLSQLRPTLAIQPPSLQSDSLSSEPIRQLSYELIKSTNPSPVVRW